MSLVVIGLSHRDAPVGVREAIACPDAAAVAFGRAFVESGLVREVVLVSTCNRVEAYAVPAMPGAEGVASARDWLARERGLGRDETALLRIREGTEAAGHLFRVAAGMDSMVLGETEVLGQLKRAYEAARRCGTTGPVLNRAFQRAFAAGKAVRSRTGIQRGRTSVASVAVAMADRIFHGLAGREVLVLGAGEAGEATARALVSRGACSVMVANRSFERAEALAREMGGKAFRFDGWEPEFPRVDVVIGTTSAPHHVLGVGRLTRLMALRGARPLLLVDLAVPRDIDPEVRRLPGVHLYDMDDLRGVAEAESGLRKAELAPCEEIVREHVMAWARRVAAGGVPG